MDTKKFGRFETGRFRHYSLFSLGNVFQNQRVNLVEQVRLAGVVGAGGGGFPTHVKLAAKADTVIANGAECEPLLHKDAVIMEEDASVLCAQ